jgi:hypothetical protein
VECVNEDGLKNPDDARDLWLSVRDCLRSIRVAGKKGHEASIVGVGQRVDDAGKPSAKGVVAMRRELPMSRREVATCKGP